LSSSDADRELERLFWPAPKKAPRSKEAQGISPAFQLLLTGSRASRSADFGSGNSTPAPTTGGQLLRAELQAHLNRAPQVLVKITGKSRGEAGVRDHLRYIGGGKAEKYEEREERESDTRESAKLEANAQKKLARDVITESGSVLRTTADLNDLQAEWRRGLSTMAWTGARAGAIHVLYQMPAGTNEHRMLEAVQATAAAEFDGHRYAMAMHTHQSTPHVHLIVRAANDVDGRRLNPRKEDLHRWRMRFAHELRERGVDAAASRQRTRGYAQRHDHLWEQKMAARAGGLRQRAERARQLGDAKLAAELDAKAVAVRRADSTRPRQADAATERQVQAARAQWVGLGQALEASASRGDRVLGQKTLEFVRKMFDGGRSERGEQRGQGIERSDERRQPSRPSGPDRSR
jgi:hypothetical protein